jgi:hypothetical protein
MDLALTRLMWDPGHHRDERVHAGNDLFVEWCYADNEENGSTTNHSELGRSLTVVEEVISLLFDAFVRWSIASDPHFRRRPGELRRDGGATNVRG